VDLVFAFARAQQLLPAPVTQLCIFAADPEFTIIQVRLDGHWRDWLSYSADMGFRDGRDTTSGFHSAEAYLHTHPRVTIDGWTKLKTHTLMDRSAYRP